MSDPDALDNIDSYTSSSGDSIHLVTPWGDGSGMIPPPRITFYNDGQEIIFVYRGRP
jgi:hypothetical protein